MPPVERPIFIVGVHRSGTTLLRYMLSSSRRIYIPPESDFIPRFFRRDPTGDLKEARISSILDTIFTRYRFAREWKGDPPLARTFAQALPKSTPSAFLNALYHQYAQQYGAVRWGDKTPIYTSYIDLIHEILPQAQFAHLIRDGRDVAVSMLDKWGEGEFHIDIYFAARDWVRRVRQAQASGARLGRDLYYELRYERLVHDPERELRALCDFLGEPYVRAMGQPHRLARKRLGPNSFSAPVRQPPNSSRVGRWRRDMSAADQRLFDYVAGDLLAELAYERQQQELMPLREQVRLAALGMKYEALQAGRGVLQAIGVFPPN
jgi:hypothetical protein